MFGEVYPKKDVIITQNEQDVPFDLRHLRYFEYTDNISGYQTLITNLDRVIRTLLR